LGGGNPLLYENLPDVLTLASERSLAVGIVSEGATLSPAVADSIALRSSWVRFSLDGPSPEIHDRIRRAPGLFALAAAAIAELRARRPRLPIGLNCVVQKDNVGHLAEMTAAAERLGADAIFFKLSHGDDPGRRFLLGADEFRQFQEWVGQSAQERHGVTTNLAELSTMLSAAVSPEDAAQGRPIRGYYLRKGIRCFVPMFFLACDSEGNAYPCDYLQGDTRPWEGHHADMRSKFCAGNILAEGDMVLERMADLVRSQVHGLPCGGYDECGCCTRFCQLNTALSWIERNHGAERAIALAVLRDRARKPEPGSAASPFL
jgi:MoaA/NifB/PqqE/SkfB family radical SAM enzyme